MKNFFVLLITLSATTSLFAADCSEANLKDCVQDNCASVGKGTWKDNQCIKIANPHASETASNCAGIKSDNATKAAGGEATEVKAGDAKAVAQ